MKRRIIWQILLHVILTGLVIYIFCSHGVIDTYLDKNTSFLILPLVGFLVADLIARVAYYASGRSIKGKAIYHLLNGAAWGFLLYCLFDRAHSFYGVLVSTYPRSSFISDMASYIPSVKSLNVPLVVFVLGMTIYSVSRISELLQTKRKVKHLGEAYGIAVMGFAVWGVVQGFREFWQPLSYIAWIPFTVCMLMSIGKLSAYRINSANGVFSDVCRWYERALGKIIVIAILLGIYLAIIRPEWIDHYRYAPLVDWTIVVSIAYYTYLNARSGLGAKHALPLVFKTWRKHMQQVEIKSGREFAQLTNVQEHFIKDGERGPLLVHLTLLLGDNEWHEERINSVLQPLINHRDIRPPWYSFIWKRRRIRRQNQETRKKLVNNIVTSLEPEKITRMKTGYRRMR
jgi:hypothetical protein